jgi:hypothetical protein
MTKKKTEQIYSNDWISRNWRPYMAWTFLCICVFDFILAPVGWTILQGEYSGHVYTQWEPMTLRGGGLFYLAMGAILGISSYGRTREKIASLGFGVGMGGEFAGGGTLEENTTEMQTMPTRNR